MPSDLHVAIDPQLVCLPTPCTSSEQIESFIDALLGWSDLLSRDDVRVSVADCVRIALFEDGEYPFPHKLRELLRGCGSDVADHETVCKVTQSLLDRTPSLEEYLGVRSVLFGEDTATVVPDYLLARLRSKTKVAFLEMLVIIAARRTLGPAGIGHVTIASPEPGAGHMSAGDEDDVTVASELHDVEWCDASWCTQVALPARISDELPLASGYLALIRQLGIWVLWDHAQSAAGATDAIEVCLQDLAVAGVDTTGRRKYVLGPRFLPSAQAWGFGARSDYCSVLVEACARIILSVPKNPLNDFYEPNSKRQRVRNDGARAFRTHLTKKGAGFRLMFWERPDGCIEFANVGDKDELVIH